MYEYLIPAVFSFRTITKLRIFCKAVVFKAGIKYMLLLSYIEFDKANNCSLSKYRLITWGAVKIKIFGYKHRLKNAR